jgi:hypothetical protein
MPAQKTFSRKKIFSAHEKIPTFYLSDALFESKISIENYHVYVIKKQPRKRVFFGMKNAGLNLKIVQKIMIFDLRKKQKFGYFFVKIRTFFMPNFTPFTHSLKKIFASCDQPPLLHWGRDV